MSFTQQGVVDPFPPSRTSIQGATFEGYTGTRSLPHPTFPHFHLPSPPTSCVISHEGHSACPVFIKHCSQSCRLYQPHVDMGRVLVSSVDSPSGEAAHC